MEGDLKEKHQKRIEDIVRTINRSFNICLNDRNQDITLSKRWGTYFFAGELFKTYFKLNKQSLAKSVIKVITAMVKELPTLKRFPKSHQVTYLYYWGVILFIDGDYATACKKLTLALELCQRSSKGNLERILLYLIPVNIIENRQRPTKELLAQFPRLQILYGDLLAALTTANLRAYDETLIARRRICVKKYIYLAMEVIRSWAVLNLVYKAYVLTNRPTRLMIEDVHRCFEAVGFFEDLALEEKPDRESQLNEVEAIIATWISQGQIKGYIAHERRTVVLSNKDPFPGRK